MEEIIKVFLLPFLVTAGTLALGAYLNRRLNQAKANADSGDAAESLSNSAKIQVEVYRQEFIVPLQQRVDNLVSQIAVLEEDRQNDMAERDRERAILQKSVKVLERKIEELDHQVQFLIGELRRSDTALELIIGAAADTYPTEVERAKKIRRGQV